MRELTRRGALIAAGAGAALLGLGGTASAAARPSPGLHYYYPVPPDPGIVRVDVCVYGATSGGVAAAVRAARAGRSVALVAFGRRLGGMTANGLGFTDIGNVNAICGLAKEFYTEVGAHYGVTGEQFTFEPHVAEAVFEQWTGAAGVHVYREHRLARVFRSDGRIEGLLTENGKIFVAPVYIDATYEGDLMAAAGVSYTVGREANTVYQETIDGVQFRTGHQFKMPVDPYVQPGNPGSGLLQGVSPASAMADGTGDRRVQSYNFRLCLTQVTANLRPFPKPRGYNPARHTLLARYINAGVWDAMQFNAPLPNGKTDLNNWGAVSTDNIGASYGWPTGDYWTRERIFQDHVTYQQGLLYFLANDPSVPATVRDQVRTWGLTRDEFSETAGWSPEIYVREGRRMLGDYVITQHDCAGDRSAPDPVGLASYTMDSHNCERLVVDGLARNEGDVEVSPAGPYGVSYRSIVPKVGECANLLVPIALSASHIAYGSVRTEQTWMVLGHAAARAADLAIEEGTPVQSVDYPTLRSALVADGMVVEWPAHTS